MLTVYKLHRLLQKCPFSTAVHRAGEYAILNWLDGQKLVWRYGRKTMTRWGFFLYPLDEGASVRLYSQHRQNVASAAQQECCSDVSPQSIYIIFIVCFIFICSEERWALLQNSEGLRNDSSEFLMRQ